MIRGARWREKLNDDLKVLMLIQGRNVESVSKAVRIYTTKVLSQLLQFSEYSKVNQVGQEKMTIILSMVVNTEIS